MEASAVLLIECQKSSGIETGGVLIGTYNKNHDHASVLEVTGPPPDSKRGPTTFERGTQGVAAYLGKLFREKKYYYLGEWHFHPNAAPDPSSVDRKQLEEIASTPAYKCPEPLMLIIGGNPEVGLNVRIFLFSAKTGHVELKASPPTA